MNSWESRDDPLIIFTMEEEIINIYCMNCNEPRSVNKMLWDEGKEFTCDSCKKKRFSNKMVMVFDKPLVMTQKFEVSIPGKIGRIIVIRKETIRETHHMGCTDGLPDDYKDHHIDYEVFRDVEADIRQQAINSVEGSLKQ